MTTTLNDFSPFIGQPVRSLQTFLRTLGQKYDEMPTVIPDGNFGEQTETSLRWFQSIKNLPATGVADKPTWDVLVSDYLDFIAESEPPLCIRVLPDGFEAIFPGEENQYLFIIQSIMKNLATVFNNIPDLQISGVHDESSINTVKSIQNILGKEALGVIDKEFWNDLAVLHETHGRV